MDKKTLLITAILSSFTFMFIGGVAVWMMELKPESTENTIPVVTSKPKVDSSIAKLTQEQVIAIVKKAQSESYLTNNQPELVLFDGQMAYEVATQTGMFYVDATTGMLLSQPKQSVTLTAYNDNQQDYEYKYHHKKNKKHREHGDD